MTDLMRNNVRALFDKCRSAHSGLLIQRGLTRWEDDEKKVKADLIDKITNIRANQLYFLAFNRWLVQTYNDGDKSNANFASVGASIEGRLFTGLPLGATLETGISVHHTYGMPMISGSSIKGMVKHYTEHLFATKNSDNEPIYQDGKLLIDKDKQAIIDVLFGSDDDNNPNAGYVIWHDAWWIPPATKKFELATSSDAKPFVEEVVTVHHQRYYNGKTVEALDTENPIPNQQLAVQGDFYFVIEAPSMWADYAKTLLIQVLKDQGLGAKTAAGYGYFRFDDKLENLNERYQHQKNKLLLASGEVDELALTIQQLSADELRAALSRDINKFFKDMGLNKEESQDKQKVAELVRQYHQEEIDEWQANPTDKNIKKALKFLGANG